jgi:hypothetical protein
MFALFRNVILLGTLLDARKSLFYIYKYTIYYILF